MNLAQIRIAARDILMAGGGQNSAIDTDDYWHDNTLNYFINAGQREIEKIIRRAQADYFTRILRTTDSALSIMGQTFTPSTLAWVAGTGNYTLPPDFVRMKLITDLSEDRVRVVMSDIRKEQFRARMYEDAQAGVTREFMADILGVRTLVIRPTPQESRDFEFIYVKRLPKLRDWTTGVVSVTNGSATATFSAAADIQNRLQVGDELIVGSGASTQITPDPNETYPVVASIDSSTTVTLAANYLGSTVSEYAFRASSVSEIPEDHHQMLVAYCVKEAFKIGPNPHPDSAALWQANFDAMIPSLVNDVEIRQDSDFESVQAYLEDEWV